MLDRKSHKILIIGAGPAGLTAGIKLVEAGFDVTIVEANSEYVGGISRTEDFNGYKFDIGGHRFFTKNKEIEKFWKETLGVDLLVRKRKSRILYDGKFYDYPLNFFNALSNLGIVQSLIAFGSYLKYKIAPLRPENTYDTWMTNRFGKVLFNKFFKTYTEKVWGTPVNKISKDWAEQRVRTFSLWNAVWTSIFKNSRKNFRTLTEEFYYPKFGPGMMWEKAAKNFTVKGGKIIMGKKVESIIPLEQGFMVLDSKFETVISTMPLRSLIRALPHVPDEVTDAASNLKYRDFLTVLLIINNPKLFEDNWLYIHDQDVDVGRIQNFKNWSGFMVPDQNKSSLGLEYFIFEGDKLWNLTDEEFLAKAKKEVVKLGLCKESEIEDGKVLRVKKAYPVYDLEYKRNVETIKDYLRQNFSGLYTIGRNGMHKWNNQDHSMMAGMILADNLINSSSEDEWMTNEESEYHESVREVPSSV